MHKLVIQSPCTEPVEKMDTTSNGFYCHQCAKTVIDFTVFSDEAIKNYFKARNYQPLCGRFTQKQLQQITISLPAQILKQPQPHWRRFLIACMLIFGTSLFPFNTTIGQQTNITATQQKIRTQKNKTIKYKKPRFVKNCYTSIKTSLSDLNNLVVGYTVTTPLEPVNPAPAYFNVSNNRKTTTKTLYKENNKKKKNEPKTPANTKEPLLAVTSMTGFIRKRNRNPLS